ncbi:Class I glutamine amidotransferase-like protein [Glarea lozoyensis ATCC 20868]|uniref:Class I glutamine amidotransferase-like protein n=1 Tax=Glarea lozoyensis (strain ATCC 20868 / MF5171) TaxID=1116229 RepID=S3DI65_GLAL2|nr:Class I glutamine amidotransferase-like protein [Glarea lozoyensis ATCC 20868]EPE31721.1 Class I glutamine amidotransferase-like protein [Glarea lozoyensis ATCC 20868]
MAATDSIPTLKVLITMHPGMNTLDFAGPLEALSEAVHDKSDRATKAFEIQFVSATEFTTTGQGAGLRAHMDFKEAYARLKEFDVLIIPGGGVDPLLKEKAEPLGLIKAYSDLQKKDPKKERTLMSVCTGSLLLAQQGLLSGLSATTHPDYYAKFEKLCSEVAQRDLAERTDVVEERYVVNNLRFDLEDEAQTPYVRRKSDAKPPTMKRKGSNAWKESNTRRESTIRRAALRLGGLRVITSGGVSAGIDAALYLVSVMVNEDVANESARVMQHTWQKGIVVDGIDI